MYFLDWKVSLLLRLFPAVALSRNDNEEKW